MGQKILHVTRRREQLVSEDKRVITRYLGFDSRRRIQLMIKRILDIPEPQVPELIDQIRGEFALRHRDVEIAFRENYREVLQYGIPDHEISEARKTLIGAYFTMEYSIESAALFNPSMVTHPDQGDVPNGSLRFLMSLRATGEGHLSSIVFKRGTIGVDGDIHFDPPPRYAHCVRPEPNPKFDKSVFMRKLKALGTSEDLVAPILVQLSDSFSLQQLNAVMEPFRNSVEIPKPLNNAVGDIDWLAHANYELRYPSDCLPSEIVIFPATECEQRGMEDLRLVRFFDEERGVRYFGTYTAFDGTRIVPMLLETSDFSTFRISTLSGRYARNKGLGIFPRKVDGRYMIIARCDGVNLYLVDSDSPYILDSGRKLIGPREPWELTQVGNCGPPLETDAGWLLITHGVGPVRQYCIGAILLDLNRPWRIIGRLREPFLRPGTDEREGYVPNVVYSCGSIIHGNQLIIPYAMSDSRTSFATVDVGELIEVLLDSGP
jgi:predicted GH43/DUF377 family glycosyl hydrolase